MKSRLVLPLLLAGLGLAPWLAAQNAPTSTPSTTAPAALAITGTRLVDGKTGRVDGPVTIVVQGERIVAVGPVAGTPVPPGAQVIDGSACWVIPGLIDAHIHQSAPTMRQLLSLGITAVHTMPQRKAPMLAAQVPSWDPAALTPRQFVTNPFFSGPYLEAMAPGAFDIRTPASPAEARAAVRGVFEQGYRRIKICQEEAATFFGPEKAVPAFPAEVFQALVDQAHELHMRVMVHVTTLKQTRLAVHTGCDVLMHSVQDEIADDELWQETRRKGIVLCPTLAVQFTSGDGRAYARKILADGRWLGILDPPTLATQRKRAGEWKPWPLLQHFADNFDRYWANIVANTRAARAHGIPIAVGSDLPPGLNTHMEMELLAEAGLSPAEVIVAATYNGARVLGLESELGTVEPGKLADFVLLRSDPTVDIRNARDAEIVVKGGRLYSVSELRQPASPTAVPPAGAPPKKI